jgi:S-adenosylmethionine:tRNA ribosyltransferase-isomerase
MKTELFDYPLPPEKIAQHPLEPRDSSKLLITRQNTKYKGQNEGFDEITFRDITSLLRPDDILVINDTRVMPARIKWVTYLKMNNGQWRMNNGGILKNSDFAPLTRGDEGGLNTWGTTKEVECLFLRNTAPDIWEIMCFPGERLKTWRTIILENWMTLEIVGETYAGRLVKVPVSHHEWLEVLQKYGEIPLPPYITEHLANSELYQTVYAENLGSTAAPTAGRHFTPELLQKIQDMWVKIAHVTLHIGPGTFKPIYEDDVTQYQIHSEFVTIPAETLELLKNRKGRVIAVGTTSMRAMESLAQGKLSSIKKEKLKKKNEGYIDDSESWINNLKNPASIVNLANSSYSGDTNLYITPGYEFQLVDALITNFHAPRTSLLVLVAAFMGLKNMTAAYRYALDHDFRFLSFGDAMWVEKIS